METEAGKEEQQTGLWKTVTQRISGVRDCAFDSVSRGGNRASLICVVWVASLRKANDGESCKMGECMETGR